MTCELNFSMELYKLVGTKSSSCHPRTYNTLAETHGERELSFLILPCSHRQDEVTESLGP